AAAREGASAPRAVGGGADARARRARRLWTVRIADRATAEEDKSPRGEDNLHRSPPRSTLSDDAPTTRRSEAPTMCDNDRSRRAAVTTRPRWLPSLCDAGSPLRDRARAPARARRASRPCRPALPEHVLARPPARYRTRPPPSETKVPTRVRPTRAPLRAR